MIGIIGAGLSGLTAGRMLAKAGHEVIVFEKSGSFGGRLATRYAGENHSVKFDHGCPHISGSDTRFLEFTNDLTEKGILKKWCDGFHYWSDGKLFERHPEKKKKSYLFAPDGFNTIGKHLSRWADVRLNTKVIGLTYLGDKKGKKRSWMLNLESSDVVEVDAVIVATPAVQAYALIENAQDETMFRNIIRKIDEMGYNPKYSLMLTYNHAEMPVWNGIHCDSETIHWISNESSKRDNNGKLTLVCHSKGDFARKHIFNNSKLGDVNREMVLGLRKIVGDWAGTHDELQIHLWRYSQPQTFFESEFVQTGYEDAPVALIGDYMMGDSAEHAFLSGYALAKSWIDVFPR